MPRDATKPSLFFFVFHLRSAAVSFPSRTVPHNLRYPGAANHGLHAFTPSSSLMCRVSTWAYYPMISTYLSHPFF